MLSSATTTAGTLPPSPAAVSSTSPAPSSGPSTSSWTTLPAPATGWGSPPPRGTPRIRWCAIDLGPPDEPPPRSRAGRRCRRRGAAGRLERRGRHDGRREPSRRARQDPLVRSAPSLAGLLGTGARHGGPLSARARPRGVRRPPRPPPTPLAGGLRADAPGPLSPRPSGPGPPAGPPGDDAAGGGSVSSDVRLRIQSGAAEHGLRGGGVLGPLARPHGAHPPAPVVAPGGPALRGGGLHEADVSPPRRRPRALPPAGPPAPRRALGPAAHRPGPGAGRRAVRPAGPAGLLVGSPASDGQPIPQYLDRSPLSVPGDRSEHAGPLLRGSVPLDPARVARRLLERAHLPGPLGSRGRLPAGDRLGAGSAAPRAVPGHDAHGLPDGGGILLLRGRHPAGQPLLVAGAESHPGRGPGGGRAPRRLAPVPLGAPPRRRPLRLPRPAPGGAPLPARAGRADPATSGMGVGAGGGELGAVGPEGLFLCLPELSLRRQARPDQSGAPSLGAPRVSPGL